MVIDLPFNRLLAVKAQGLIARGNKIVQGEKVENG